jgi:hypothetical protein
MKILKNTLPPGHLFAGLIVLILAMSLSCSFGNDFYKNSIIVKGKVTGVSKKAIYRSAIVTFTTRKGRRIVFKSKLDTNVDLFDYTIGQTVEVIYSPKDPYRTASINTFAERSATKIMYKLE